MIDKENICTLIAENESKLTIDDLRSISFLCDCLAQEREIALLRESEEVDKLFFYTGK